MVFQNYALFPHMSVFDNVAFGLSVRGQPSADMQERVERDAGAGAALGHGEARTPRQLSGGQQQRIALARALVTRPQLLLLDEPLGALDKRLRQQMQIELKQIQREVGITTVFVTHDQEEALTLSDRIAIFNEGRVVQAGKPPWRSMSARPRPSPPISWAMRISSRARSSAPGRRCRRGRRARDRRSSARGRIRRHPCRAAGEDLSGDRRMRRRSDRAIAWTGRLSQAVYSGMSTIYKVSVGGRELTVFAQNRSGQDFVRRRCRAAGMVAGP